MGGPSFVICAQVEQIAVGICEVSYPPIGLDPRFSRLARAKSKNSHSLCIEMFYFTGKVKMHAAALMRTTLKT